MNHIERAIHLWMVYHIGQDPNPKIGEVVGWLIDEWPARAAEIVALSDEVENVTGKPPTGFIVHPGHD